LLLPALPGRSVQGFAVSGFSRFAGGEGGGPLSAVTGKPA